MVESALYVNQQLVYQTDFLNPFTSEIGVTWDLRNKSCRPVSSGWCLTIIFISIQLLFLNKWMVLFRCVVFSFPKEFDFKKIGLKGSIFWQPDSPEELAVPELWYSASLYGRIKIFDRKVVLMPGIDITTMVV